MPWPKSSLETSDMGYSLEEALQMHRALMLVETWMNMENVNSAPLDHKSARAAQAWARGCFGSAVTAALQVERKTPRLL